MEDPETSADVISAVTDRVVTHSPRMVLYRLVRALKRDARAGAVPQSEQEHDADQQPDEKRDAQRLHDRLSFRATALIRSYHKLAKKTRAGSSSAPVFFMQRYLLLPKILRYAPHVFDDDKEDEEVDDVLDRQEEQGNEGDAQILGDHVKVLHEGAEGIFPGLL